MCREDWQTFSDTTIALSMPGSELDPQAFQVYVDWFYIGEFDIESAISTGFDVFNVHLLEAWTVSNAVADARFRNALIARLT
jgi:hypothetical protein